MTEPLRPLEEPDLIRFCTDVTTRSLYDIIGEGLVDPVKASYCQRWGAVG
jgi:hypothetical protein